MNDNQISLWLIFYDRFLILNLYGDHTLTSPDDKETINAIKVGSNQVDKKDIGKAVQSTC